MLAADSGFNLLHEYEGNPVCPIGENSLNVKLPLSSPAHNVSVNTAHPGETRRRTQRFRYHIVRSLLLLAAFIGILVTADSGLAQGSATSGVIEGTVGDPNGAVVSRAAVSAAQEATGLIRQTLSDEIGRFRVIDGSDLVAGLYGKDVREALLDLRALQDQGLARSPSGRAGRPRTNARPSPRAQADRRPRHVPQARSTQVGSLVCVRDRGAAREAACENGDAR